MNKITNYNELIAERRRLENKILTQQVVISTGIHDLMEKLEPLHYLLRVLTIFDPKKPGTPLLGSIVSSGLDLLVGQNLSSKVMWLAKMIIPIFQKKIKSRSAITSED